MDRCGRDPQSLESDTGTERDLRSYGWEAEEKSHFLQSLIPSDVGRELLSNELGLFDLSPFPVDGPLPLHLIPADKLSSSGKRIVAKAKAEGSTIREMYKWYGSARGQRTLTGSPQRVVDHMEEWFLAEGVDGYLIQPSYLPGELNEFVELVIPELVRRGLFRSDYEGATLRENLGLLRPASRYARSLTAADGI